ncbi:YbhB/YbcL family Raf kinase inhibitor-like protein [Holzapfeliella sp. He02]|uniref:YbhB/YbcL family Raf kinase inhibitor-like protein n=1 Tax=Holzapfeliella saturejae TaxID=3082953 RepID=A0ABU8SHS3_9LACO
MKLNVQLNNGLLPDQYTKHCSNNSKHLNFPKVSFPIEITGVPENAKTLVLTLTDLDAVPVCGFEWIHWLAANINPKTTLIPENAGQDNPLNWTCGYNSLAGKYLDLKNDPMSMGYVGPAPPDDIHNYTLRLFALDYKPNLMDGFWYNDLMKAIKGHIIDQTEVNLPVKA